jgi:adenylate cyclase
LDALAVHDLFEFEGFCLDRHSGGLFRQDPAGSLTPMPIGSRALDVLGALVSRPGELLSKQAIMQAVWPGMVVDEKNLTVQIATLRRVLDDGRTDRSCIQTEAGRGYRFVASVTRKERDELPPASSSPPTISDETASPPAADAQPSVRQAPWRHRLTATLAASGILLAGILVAFAWAGGWIGAGKATPPRLSIVVLPLQDMDDDPTNDYLADAITDDLTTELSRISGAWVIARETASTYRGKATDVRQIGRELGVRYVLEGSVRKIGPILRVNVQLISGETGVHLWSDRFDQDISELGAGQEQIVTRMRSELGIGLVEIEAMRSLRERPANPDAFDLILRARALTNLPPSLQRNDEARLLYERALEQDPSSAPALLGIAYYLIDRAATIGQWSTFGDLQRVESLLDRARAVAPHSREYLNTMAYWLRTRGRCHESMAFAEETIRRFPINPGAYNYLAQCKITTGQAAEALPLIEKAIRISPRDPYMFNRYRVMGSASVMLGRDSEAIAYYERTLAVSTDDDGNRHWTYRGLAVANARSGRMPEAKRALAEANRIWPYDTVRSHSPDKGTNAIFAAQVRSRQDGLRLAGERDHADEDADFGVPADDRLHSEAAGPTPTTAPGVRTIRTGDLVSLLADARPVIIDTLTYSRDRSLPRAVGLEYSGLGGSFADEAQDRLLRKMAELTGGKLNQPVVVVGWNSERFDGRNLALRLVAIGYTRVYWYRGGREAWEVAELPETELVVQEW